MELRQLRYFVLLAEELHFTRAAVRANVAQPALSRQIQALEAELGVPLVDRTTRRVALTDAGERLVTRARRILEEVEVARAETVDQRKLLTGRLTIGVSATPGEIDVAGLVAAFHRAHPGVELRVRDGLSVALVGAVLADDLDLAFVTTGHPRLQTASIASEPLALAVGPGHRLATRRRVSMAELRDERFVVFADGATIRAQVQAAAAAAGFAPRIAVELGDVARMRALVAAGFGVAVLPVSQIAGDVRAVTLTDPALVHAVELVRRRDRQPSPAVRAFWAMAVAFA